MTGKRFIRGLLKGVLWTLLALALVHTAFNIAGSWKIRAAQQRLVAAGLPMTWAQLYPPPAKVSENAAPILKLAFDLMRPGWASTNWHQVRSIQEDLDAAQKKLKSKALTPELIAEWANQMSNSQARTQIKQTTPKLDLPPPGALESMPTEQRATWKQKLNSAPYVAAAQLLSEAGAKPRCDFFHLDYHPSTDLPGLHSGPLLFAGKLLTVRARLAAGSVDENWADLLTTLRLANLLQEDPLLITQLVRNSLISLALDAVQGMVRETDRPPLAAESLHAMMAEMQRAEALRQPTSIAAINAERIYGSSEVEKIMAGYVPVVDPLAANFMQKRYMPVVIFLLKPWIKFCYADHLERLATLRTMVAPPYCQVGPQRKTYCSLENTPRWNPMTRVLLAGLWDATVRFDEAQAKLQVSRLGLAAELYWRQHGTYPEHLEALAAYTPVPVDPFTGRPFVYRREGAGFKLYSLGPNLKDDGGVPRDNAKYHEDYDIVWSTTAPAKVRKD